MLHSSLPPQVLCGFLAISAKSLREEQRQRPTCFRAPRSGVRPGVQGSLGHCSLPGWEGQGEWWEMLGFVLRAPRMFGSVHKPRNYRWSWCGKKASVLFLCPNNHHYTYRTSFLKNCILQSLQKVAILLCLYQTCITDIWFLIFKNDQLSKDLEVWAPSSNLISLSLPPSPFALCFRPTPFWHPLAWYLLCFYFLMLFFVVLLLL